jgi:hypothetical protein
MIKIIGRLPRIKSLVMIIQSESTCIIFDYIETVCGRLGSQTTREIEVEKSCKKRTIKIIILTKKNVKTEYFYIFLNFVIFICFST